MYEEMHDIVNTAAGLLPDPPSPGNHEGYTAWAALVIDTAYRLARVLGADTDLLRSLSGDDQRTPVAWRERRRLLLSVALFEARRPSKAQSASAGIPRRLLIVGAIATTAARNPHPLALHPVLYLGWRDAA